MVRHLLGLGKRGEGARPSARQESRVQKELVLLPHWVPALLLRHRCVLMLVRGFVLDVRHAVDLAIGPLLQPGGRRALRCLVLRESDGGANLQQPPQAPVRVYVDV